MDTKETDHLCHGIVAMYWAKRCLVQCSRTQLLVQNTDWKKYGVKERNRQTNNPPFRLSLQLLRMRQQPSPGPAPLWVEFVGKSVYRQKCSSGLWAVGKNSSKYSTLDFFLEKIYNHFWISQMDPYPVFLFFFKENRIACLGFSFCSSCFFVRCCVSHFF